jgi:ribonuclease HII
VSALVAGIDEAGRGPLAGPVVAAAVILGHGTRIPGLRDSKAMSAAERERAAGEIRKNAVATGIGWADAREIDCLNILEATHLAMRRALLALPRPPGHVLVDGPWAPKDSGLGFSCTYETIIKGDTKIPAISAASVLAKTWRDAFMAGAERLYPGYGFSAHKGYGTVAHLEALSSLGPCRLHRLSFEPVRSPR